MNVSLKLGLAILWIVIVAPSAGAATITYVDAIPDGPGANVTVAGNPIVDGANFLLNQGDFSQAPDGLWSERNRAGMNGGSVLVSFGGADAAEDSDAVLWTPTPTLAAGTYDIYTFFWIGINSAGNPGPWDISAAIGQETTFANLVDYTSANATNIAAATTLDGYDLDPALLKDGGSAVDLFGVRLGQVVLNASGEVTVSVAGALNPGGDTRTWFDGIGYVAIPEPSSVVLLSLAGIGLAWVVGRKPARSSQPQGVGAASTG